MGRSPETVEMAAFARMATKGAEHDARPRLLLSQQPSTRMRPLNASPSIDPAGDGRRSRRIGGIRQ